MLISDDVKLDYSDVLIRPKRSTLTSRFDVEMKKTYKFYHSQKEWTGIPIMASNMDTVGTFEMYTALTNFDMVTCIAKHYNRDKENWWKFAHQKRTETLCVMGGISNEDMNDVIRI